MSDSPNPQPILAMSGQVPPLPTQSVAHFALSLTVSEFILALGQTHALIEPTPTGASANLVPGWFLGLSLSPPAALQLLKTIEAGIKSYETQFGKIAEDPRMRMATSDGPASVS